MHKRQESLNEAYKNALRTHEVIWVLRNCAKTTTDANFEVFLGGAATKIPEKTKKKVGAARLCYERKMTETTNISSSAKKKECPDKD